MNVQTFYAVRIRLFPIFYPNVLLVKRALLSSQSVIIPTLSFTIDIILSDSRVRNVIISSLSSKKSAIVQSLQLLLLSW